MKSLLFLLMLFIPSITVAQGGYASINSFSILDVDTNFLSRTDLSGMFHITPVTDMGATVSSVFTSHGGWSFEKGAGVGFIHNPQRFKSSGSVLLFKPSNELVYDLQFSSRPFEFMGTELFSSRDFTGILLQDKPLMSWSIGGSMDLSSGQTTVAMAVVDQNFSDSNSRITYKFHGHYSPWETVRLSFLNSISSTNKQTDRYFSPDHYGVHKLELGYVLPFEHVALTPTISIGKQNISGISDTIMGVGLNLRARSGKTQVNLSASNMTNEYGNYGAGMINLKNIF